MGPIKDIILKHIKEDKIRPKPRWSFLIENAAVWVSGFLSVFIGALSFSVIVYMTINNEWGLVKELNAGFFRFAIMTMPLFWIIITAVLILLAHYNIKRTKHGYRFRLFMIVPAVVISSLLFGTLLYGAGAGKAIDSQLARHAPFYNRLFNPQMRFWSIPDSGRILGEVIKVFDNGNFELVSPDGRSWEVNADEALKHPPIIVGVGIKIVGTSSESGIFKAVHISPIGPGRDWLRSRNVLDRMRKMRPDLKRHFEECEMSGENMCPRIMPD